MDVGDEAGDAKTDESEDGKGVVMDGETESEAGEEEGRAGLIKGGKES